MKTKSLGAPGWLSVEHQTRDFSSGHDLAVREFKPPRLTLHTQHGNRLGSSPRYLSTICPLSFSFSP